MQLYLFLELKTPPTEIGSLLLSNSLVFGLFRVEKTSWLFFALIKKLVFNIPSIKKVNLQCNSIYLFSDSLVLELKALSTERKTFLNTFKHLEPPCCLVFIFKKRHRAGVTHDKICLIL